MTSWWRFGYLYPCGFSGSLQRSNQAVARLRRETTRWAYYRRILDWSTGYPLMDRRTFVALASLGLLAAPIVRAQALYRIAFVEAGANSANRHFLDAFMLGLRELGYEPGKNIVVD